MPMIYLPAVRVPEELRAQLERIAERMGPDTSLSDVRRMAYREFIARHEEAAEQSSGTS